MNRDDTGRPQARRQALPDVTDLVPHARRVNPRELVAGDAVFETTGAVHRITEVNTVHDGRVVSIRHEAGHRLWFWDDEPIVAVLDRAAAPTLTRFARTLDPDDEDGWASGDPAVIDTERESLIWEPDDGDPVRWAVAALHDWGTIEPSCSPPYTLRTWYTAEWTDWARHGATVDVSAHLASFTRAEAEAIGERVTAAPRRRTTPEPAARSAEVAVGRATAMAMVPRRRATPDGIAR